MRTDNFEILKTHVAKAAERLLGSYLILDLKEGSLRFKIVETEAYDQSDAASHSYKGKTPRTEAMFGPAGYLYVYFTYGMHYCCNVVVGTEGYGAAALIRAVEPMDVVPALIQKRRGKEGIELTNGPAKVCQALGITTVMNGHDLSAPPLELKVMRSVSATKVIRAPRIGIRDAREVPWRFYIKGNPYVSRPHSQE